MVGISLSEQEGHQDEKYRYVWPYPPSCFYYFLQLTGWFLCCLRRLRGPWTVAGSGRRLVTEPFVRQMRQTGVEALAEGTELSLQSPGPSDRRAFVAFTRAEKGVTSFVLDSDKY